MIKKSLVLFTIAIVLSSCQNQAKPSTDQSERIKKIEREVSDNKFLAEIDSLIIVAEYLNEKMLSTRADEIRAEYEEVKYLYHSIVEHYPNKENKDFWINEIDQIYRVENAYKKFIKEAPSIEENLAYTLSQLKALRNSFNDGQLSEEEVGKYIAEEAKALGEVHFRIRKRQPEAEIALTIWDSLGPHYDSLNTALLQQ